MGQDSRPRSFTDQLLATFLLLFLAWMMWHLMLRPSWPSLRVRLLRLCIPVTSRLARRTAVLSMGRELRTGVEDYRVPYWLSVKRDEMRAGL